MALEAKSAGTRAEVKRSFRFIFFVDLLLLIYCVAKGKSYAHPVQMATPRLEPAKHKQ
jgi:hypothetical protein